MHEKVVKPHRVDPSPSRTPTPLCDIRHVFFPPPDLCFCFGVLDNGVSNPPSTCVSLGVVVDAPPLASGSDGGTPPAESGGMDPAFGVEALDIACRLKVFARTVDEVFITHVRYNLLINQSKKAACHPNTGGGVQGGAREGGYRHAQQWS